MKKKRNKIFFMILIYFICIFPTIYSQQNNHFAKEISISIGGTDFTLENAFKNEKLTGDYSITNKISSQANIFGHQNDAIYLNVNGTFKTLKSAIEDGSLKCAQTGKSPANYQPIIHGEYANNIWVEEYQMNLQTALDQGKFYSGDSYCIKPVITEYYVCSPCANIRHSDLSLYWKAKYSRTGKEISRKNLIYCWGGLGWFMSGENIQCPTEVLVRRFKVPVYKFSWLPPNQEQGFKYVKYERLGLNSDSETAKAVSKCNNVRNNDPDCQTRLLTF